MAERRMFHTSVVESDTFLDLPLAAQALYFHIGMHADDDGFVNGPRQIARAIGATPADLQTLIDSGFLLWYDGVVVIRHFRVANTLQKDRIKPLNYPKIAQSLYILPNRTYTELPEAESENLLQLRENLLDSNWNPFGILKEDKVIRNKKNLTEPSVSEPEPPDRLAPDPTEEKTLKLMGGKLGKGVVLLSDEEQGLLLDKLGLDGFDHYVEKLAQFILRGNKKINNHYATILRWWQEDRGGNHENETQSL